MVHKTGLHNILYSVVAMLTCVIYILPKMPSAVLNCIFTCAVHAESPSGPDVELVAEKQRILFWEYFGYKR